MPIKPKKVKDLTGQKFGRLVVLEFAERTKFYTFWKVKCICGTIKNVRAGALKNGLTKSCGCLAKQKSAEQGRKTFAGIGGAGFGIAKSTYIHHAKQRNLIFKLNNEQLKKLFKGKCYYCNANPATKSFNRNTKISQKTKKLGQFIYNGIDRVDNSKGYIIKNCVSCCRKCNQKKMAITKKMIYKAYHFLFGNQNG